MKFNQKIEVQLLRLNRYLVSKVSNDSSRFTEYIPTPNQKGEDGPLNDGPALVYYGVYVESRIRPQLALVEMMWKV